MSGMDESDWRRVPVWDAPTRLFHWLVVALVVACYVTFRLNWMDWHAWAGEAVLALLLFRLLWGVFGSDTARFSHFIAPPAAAIRHLMHLHHREPDIGVGHNPAGGWMVIAMIAILLGQTLTGLYENNDIADEGPLTELVPARVADLIADLHTILWDVLLAVIALHLLANSELFRGEAAQSAAPDAHRPQAAARGDSRPAHRPLGARCPAAGCRGCRHRPVGRSARAPDPAARPVGYCFGREPSDARQAEP